MSDQFELSVGGHVAVYCGPKENDGEHYIGLDVKGALNTLIAQLLTRGEAIAIAQSLLSHAGVTLPRPATEAVAVQRQIEDLKWQIASLQMQVQQHRHLANNGVAYFFP